MNTIATPETKDVYYSKCYRNFSEVDVETGETVDGTFQLDSGISGRIIRQDKYTIVILADGSKGISECAEGERFSRKKGLRIAFNRALIKHLERETEKLCWSQMKEYGKDVHKGLLIQAEYAIKKGYTFVGVSSEQLLGALKHIEELERKLENAKEA